MAMRTFIPVGQDGLLAGRAQSGCANAHAAAGAEFFVRLQTNLASGADTIAAGRAAAFDRVEMRAAVGASHDAYQPILNHNCV